MEGSWGGPDSSWHGAVISRATSGRLGHLHSGDPAGAVEGKWRPDEIQDADNVDDQESGCWKTQPNSTGG